MCCDFVDYLSLYIGIYLREIRRWKRDKTAADI